MNNIINKFLLTGEKFMPELHLKQPGFTYIVFVPFTKLHERIQKFREAGNLKHLYRNTAHSDSKDLTKGTISDKILKDRAYEVAGNHGYNG